MEHQMDVAHETLLNLNGANEHELTQLPHIGADKARKIVHYRAIRKGFRDWADFASTPGITEADVEAIRARAWIGPPVKEVLAGTSRQRRSRGPATARRPRRPGS
jgi:DNA uptake protein ComE-like DNA-binding protein